MGTLEAAVLVAALVVLACLLFFGQELLCAWLLDSLDEKL